MQRRLDMQKTTGDEARVPGRLGGTTTLELLSPGDDAYDEARRLWNAVIDRRPAVIARCRTSGDVRGALRLAHERGLPVAVRGGGHNVAGLALLDGGLVVDLTEMNEVTVDPRRRTVTAEGGATIGDLDRVTQGHALAVPMGVVSATGIAGLTLGGGMGWLRRRYGLSCDAMIGATVVTADGRTVRAGEGEGEDPDLLWGLRGGGGNFGVVTSFTYRAYPVGPDVAFSVTFYPQELASDVVRVHDAFIAADAGDVSTLVALGRMPHEEAFDSEVRGRSFIAVLAMHAGDAEVGWKALEPLRSVGEPLADVGGIMPYLDAQRFFDGDYPDGLRYYWRSIGLAELGEEVLATLLRHAAAAPSDRSTLDVWFHGGAVAGPAADATAYGRRDLPYLVNAEANWEAPEEDAANIAWARAVTAELERLGASRPYLNFPGFLEDAEAQVRAVYGANRRRLALLKRRFDPDNVFRANHNIVPAEAEG